jgi:hypothetical protein
MAKASGKVKPKKKNTTKKGASKGKPTAKAKPKVAKKTPIKKTAPVKKAASAKKATPAKKPAPAKKSLLKTATKIASKAVAALSKVDKERAKKEALKAKLAAQKEKEQAKKEAEKAKLLAKKEKEQAKKEAEKAKLLAKKEKELAAKEAEKAKKVAAKEAEKAKALAAKEAEKAKLKAEKEAAKRKAKGGGDDDEGEDGFSASPKIPRGEDDDEAEFIEVAKKSKDRESYKKYDMNDLEGKIADEISVLRESFAWHEIVDAIGTMEFFVDPKDDSCIEKGCDNIRTTLSWCRLHYIKNWKHIQRKQDILKEGKLQEFIEELISKYPPKYIEAIIKDLADDRDFYRVLNELNITSEFEFEEDDFESANDDDDAGDDIGIEQTFTGSMRYEDTE